MKIYSQCYEIGHSEVVKFVNLEYDIYGALRDLVPFVQFKKREKHPWRSVNFSKSKVAGLNSQTN